MNYFTKVFVFCLALCGVAGLKSANEQPDEQSELSEYGRYKKLQMARAHRYAAAQVLQHASVQALHSHKRKRDEDWAGFKSLLVPNREEGGQEIMKNFFVTGRSEFFRKNEPASPFRERLRGVEGRMANVVGNKLKSRGFNVTTREELERNHRKEINNRTRYTNIVAT